MKIVCTAIILCIKFLVSATSLSAGMVTDRSAPFTPALPAVSDTIPAPPQVKDQVPDDVARIFRDIEAGLVAADIGKFAQHFGKVTFLSIRNSRDAYYSGNQAYYILKDHFAARRVVSFKFSLLTADERSPYATGGGVIRYRGSNELFQVYVALSRADDRWVIARLNIY